MPGHIGLLNSSMTALGLETVAQTDATDFKIVFFWVTAVMMRVWPEQQSLINIYLIWRLLYRVCLSLSWSLNNMGTVPMYLLVFILNIDETQPFLFDPDRKDGMWHCSSPGGASLCSQFVNISTDSVKTYCTCNNQSTFFIALFLLIFANRHILWLALVLFQEVKYIQETVQLPKPTIFNSFSFFV